MNLYSTFAIPINDKNTVEGCLIKREISSAGSEHLPYKQGVTGSNPVSPTTENQGVTLNCNFFFFAVYTLVYTNTNLCKPENFDVNTKILEQYQTGLSYSV